MHVKSHFSFRNRILLASQVRCANKTPGAAERPRESRMVPTTRDSVVFLKLPRSLFVSEGPT
jgi:hypothetical protein